MEIENTEILMVKDGTFKTIDYIKEILPFGDDIMHLAVYKSVNEEQLTKEEIEKIELDISRLQQSYKIQLEKSIEEQDKIAKERLEAGKPIVSPATPSLN